jgi:hypothetical protein
MKDTDDRDDLGFMGGPKFAIGYVEEVNGRGSEECPGYPASRFELTILARHWMTELFFNQLWCWRYAMSGSRESRILHYASRRLGRLEAILGKDDMDKVEQEVEEKCRRKWGEETWDAFNRDDTEWRDRELARIYAESDSDDEARNTPGTPSPNA